MSSVKELVAKVEMLHREVSYAMHATHTVPCIIPLSFSNKKEMESTYYAACLLTYFSNWNNLTKLTMSDLKNVLILHSAMFGSTICSNFIKLLLFRGIYHHCLA